MKKTPYTQKSLNVLALIFFLSVSGVGFRSYSQVGPGVVNAGIVIWLDANVNDAPVISSVPVTSVEKDNIYTYKLASTDVDINDELTYSAPELPLWLIFNNSTGILSGTPTNEFIGNHEVTLRVNDGTVDVDQIFIITVLPNIAPVVVAGQTFSVDEKSPEGTDIGLALAVDDDRNTLMNWTIVDGNQGRAFLINPSTGMISVNKAVELDFDIHSSFTLLIAVGDGFSVSLPVSVTITVNDVMKGLQFYSAFSPNGDGRNDKWEIDGLSAYPESHTKIFNADGVVMFSNMGYTAQWDGIYKGKEMPLGTYYYIVSLNDGTGKKLNGYFMVIK